MIIQGLFFIFLQFTSLIIKFDYFLQDNFIFFKFVEKKLNIQNIENIGVTNFNHTNFFNIYDAENTMKSVFAIYESAKSGKEIRI